ncbi:hypothetical protein [Companilactobacillus insicii]|uniref:hypothetical protein n=1 Tax=Companilactobacillus insicii TaxID=1732567 RepID=UPI000F78365E|nr:hypothetical protein [Companilactobacillus insicii]
MEDKKQSYKGHKLVLISYISNWWHQIRWRIFWVSLSFIGLVSLLLWVSFGHSIAIFANETVSKWVSSIALIIAILWLLISDSHLYKKYVMDMPFIADRENNIFKYHGTSRNIGYGLAVVSFLWGIFSMYFPNKDGNIFNVFSE